MIQILVGTSGWMYKDWNKAFFPPEVTGVKQLPYYARFFRTVELNVSFYRLPAARVFSTWRRNAGPDFLFSVKLNRYITHRKRLILDEESRPYLKSFLANAGRLREVFGVLLIQLPPSFKAKPERLDMFLKTINAALKRRVYSPCLAIEFRHPSWFTEETYTILRRHRTALVIAQSSSGSSPRVFTTDFSYVRMHGPGALYASKYSERQIADWFSFMRRQKQIKRFFVYFNNDFHAHAIVNARSLAEKARTTSVSVGGG